MLKEFWEEEDAVAVVEIILILAVLVTIALIFRKAIVKWVTDIIKKIFEGADEAGQV